MIAAVLVAGSEEAAAHRLGMSHSTANRHLASARSKVGVAPYRRDAAHTRSPPARTAAAHVDAAIRRFPGRQSR